MSDYFLINCESGDRVPNADPNVQSSTITSSVYSASKPQGVELFGGCGGLALASRQEGLQHAIIVDNNARCVATLHKNGFGTAPNILLLLEQALYTQKISFPNTL